MNLMDQSNDDFKISNAEKFTYVTTWFGVDVTFERRRPGKMMLIKTYVQPFWQTRIQEKVSKYIAHRFCPIVVNSVEQIMGRGRHDIHNLGWIQLF